MSRPNLLLVVADDHAANAVGCYGGHPVTPSIDRLAAEGLRFDACGCTNSLCSPSRATILTGTYNHRNGVTTLSTEFDNRQPTFPGLLRESGYRTALVGKWHLGHGGAHDPRGFDTWEVLPDQGEYVDPTFLTSDGDEHVRPGYATDVITDLALDWLGEVRDGPDPWCLLVQHKAPHRPWLPAERHRDLFEDEPVPAPDTFFDDYAHRARAAREARMRVARDLNAEDLKAGPPGGLDDKGHALWALDRYLTDYLRCVVALDENVGRLLDHLDATGRAADTVVVYTSDQGFFLGEHGWYDKRFMYRESLEMPLLVRYPPLVAPGSTSDALVLNVDLAQTFLELAGVPAPERMQGRSLVPLLSGRRSDEVAWRTQTYYRYWEHLDSIHRVAAHRGLRTRERKLVHYYGSGCDQPGASTEETAAEWELFDLERDPAELHSVHDDPAYADDLARLRADLDRVARELGDEVPAAPRRPVPDNPRRPTVTDARTDWEERIGIRSGQAGTGRAPRLDPPQQLSAVAGGHQVTLDWTPVPGAIGYQVYASDSADGEFEPVDHAGRDVLAVPHPPYVDTTGSPGQQRWYAIATLSDIAVQGEPSERVVAAADTEAGAVTLAVDASGDAGRLDRPWRPMIGSEHLSHALSTDTTGGRVVGEELTAALRAARTELGVETVRAHAILSEDPSQDYWVYREVDGEPVHDFSGVDRVYDHVRGLGLYPVVEISFMPHDLASDPSTTVFEYSAIVSPPKDWQRWYDLVRDLTAHLVERYGREEVVHEWSFEVWNEPNLEVFWSGTPQEYMKMYDLTVAAVREVDERLVVGGPSSAASGWVEELLAHVEESGAPLDFVSTHTYGSPPLDFRASLERYGRAGTPIWWTEWGVTPTHFNEVSDAVFAGVFLLRGMASAMDRIDALSYWVVSDHFEELGRPAALLHGGFGLRTVGELRKPRWWALALLERLDDQRLPVRLAGDGAGSLVEALATRDARDGTLSVLVWNMTLDQTKAAGSADLARHVQVTLHGAEPGSTYLVRQHGVDAHHSNIAAVWGELREEGQNWPSEEQWQQLRAADRLERTGSEVKVVADDAGTLVVELDLEMPSMHLLRLSAT